ncbi:hypothetical protein BC831DRAFT_479849 [Entophlyctis helioformis]|nr:hypothetical protein BC831DRAFT_479849 [Entophlyctis helioformis]
MSVLDRLSRLPWELQNMIFASAGPLAQYLHGWLPRPVSLATASLLWAEAFDLDCVDPVVALVLPPIDLTWHLLFVRSQRMATAVQPLMPMFYRPDERWPTWLDIAERRSFWTHMATRAFQYCVDRANMALFRDLVDRIAVLCGVPFPTKVSESASAYASTATTSAAAPLSDVVSDRNVTACLLVGAASVGREDLVVSLLTRRWIDTGDWRAALYAASRSGQMTTTKRLCRNAKMDRAVFVDGAVAGGHVDVLRQLVVFMGGIPHDHGQQPSQFQHLLASHVHPPAASSLVVTPEDSRSVQAAIASRQTAALMWVLEQGAAVWGSEAFMHLQTEAARHGDLELLAFSYRHGIGERVGTRGVDAAAAGGHVHVLAWLHEQEREQEQAQQPQRQDRPSVFSASAMHAAAASGSLASIEWLHKHRREGCTTEALDGAALHGHYGVVQWLRQHRREGFTARALHCDDDAIARLLVGDLSELQRSRLLRRASSRSGRSALVVARLALPGSETPSQ